MRGFGADVVASPAMDRFYTPLCRYKAAKVEVEGDWSSAAFTIAAGSLGGESVTSGLSSASSQADRSIVDILRYMGAEVKVESGGVRSSWSKLSGIDYDLSDCPDLFPVVSALCASSGDESRLHGLTRLRLKESDRLEAMAEGLNRMGAEVEVSGGEVRIRGGHLSGAEVHPRRDHRIAMALAVASLAAEGETTIADAECVSKSYPGFWGDMEELGVKVMRT
jgi:3-phosphoshikimate 1-carboxyvinyltransferase